jgi:hypothetical protein
LEKTELDISGNKFWKPNARFKNMTPPSFKLLADFYPKLTIINLSGNNLTSFDAD